MENATRIFLRGAQMRRYLSQSTKRDEVLSRQ